MPETNIDVNNYTLILIALGILSVLLLGRLAVVKNRIKKLNQLIAKLSKDPSAINEFKHDSHGPIGQLEESVAHLAHKISQQQQTAQTQVSEMSFELAEREAVLSSIGEGIVVADAHGNIIMVNQSAQDMLNESFKDVKGKSVFETFLIEDEAGQVLPRHETPMAQALDKGETTRAQPRDNYYFVRQNHERFPVSIVATPVKLNGQITGAIEVFRDVTKEKEVDRAKSEFVSLASHQLRTPLTVIKWYIRKLLDPHDHKNKEATQEYLTQVYHTTQNMVELVNAILNVSRIDLGTLAVDPEEINLETIVDNVLFEFGPQINDKTIKVKKTVDPKTPPLLADPKLIRIVFQNLISNALKYTPKEGKIEVLVEPQEGDILIKVSDTGCGIPENQKGKIFTKLFRADNARQIQPDGTGLGLYIVKAVVDEAGGEIWFETKLNQGTSFYITLPIAGMKQKSGVTGLT